MLSYDVVISTIRNNKQQQVLESIKRDITTAHGKILTQQEILRKLLAEKVEWEEAFARVEIFRSNNERGATS